MRRHNLTVKLKTHLFNKFRRLLLDPSYEPLLIKLVTGHEAESWRAKVLPNHYQYSRGTFRTAERGGIKYELDISSLVDWFVYFGLTEKNKQVAFSLVRPGDVVIDVGTNIGEFLLNFALRAGPSGRVYGFEPDQENFSLCKRNIALNSLANITLEPLALAHERNQFSFAKPDRRNSGANRISSDGNHSVTAITMDEYVTQKKITRVDLIKIDVEGFETNVIRGARDTLIRHKPLLFLELDDSNLRAQSSSAAELLTMLSSLAYTITDARSGLSIDPRSGLEKIFHTDILCKPIC